MLTRTRQNPQCSGWRSPRTNGGSADLSTFEVWRLPKGQYENRNIRFGVREHGMGAICNGLALDGSGLIPYGATFMCFTDYRQRSALSSALSEAGVIYMTHDSIALGEDGPTTG